MSDSNIDEIEQVEELLRTRNEALRRSDKSNIRQDWIEEHATIAFAYFIFVLVFVIFFAISRLLIGKIDFININSSFVAQPMVTLYYIYIFVIFQKILKLGKLSNYMPYDRARRLRSISRNIDLSSPPTREEAIKKRRKLIRSVIHKEISDSRFVLFAFVPVTALFYLCLLMWSNFDEAAFVPKEMVDKNSLAVFTLEIFAKGFLSDVIEHFNIKISNLSLDNKSYMLSIFILVFRTSISFLLIGSIYKYVGLYNRSKNLSALKAHIAAITLHMEQEYRFLENPGKANLVIRKSKRRSTSASST